MLFKAGQTHDRGDGADGPQARPPPATTAPKLAPSKSPPPRLGLPTAAKMASFSRAKSWRSHWLRHQRWIRRAASASSMASAAAGGAEKFCTFSRWQARPSSCTRGWLVGPGGGSVRLRVLLCVERAGTRCGYRPCQRRWWIRRCTGRTPPSAVTSEWQVSGSRLSPSRGLTLPPISPPTRPQTCRPSRAAGIHALRSLVHSCRYWQTVPASCSCAPSDLFLPQLKSSTCCGQLCRHICSPTLA